jgi:MinD-like ATPase involved in chromosome partitioning or flagellar assembly
MPETRGGSPEHLRAEIQTRVIELNSKTLEANRIVAHGSGDREHGRYFDMLRTQVLQDMDHNGWQFLAITSPTAGCGKTVTSCNLAMSAARLTGRSVLLVDFDLQKPRVADYLGLGRKKGVLSLLENRMSLSDAVITAQLGNCRFFVLPGEACERGSAEWMASQATSSLLQYIKRDFRSSMVIFDLPPILVGDDVISILPQMDAVLLVAGVGSSSLSDLKECRKHLANKPVVRVLINRVKERADDYYSYGYD